MQAIWFNGAKDKEEAKQDIALGSRAFIRLAAILEKKSIKPSSSDYDIVSWPYYRADADGYNRALTEVLKLIKTEGH